MDFIVLALDARRRCIAATVDDEDTTGIDVLGGLIDCIISERIGPDSVSPIVKI